ncbi:MAG: NEW3 domain-containing protein [Dehalococcoidales bacterium]|nr:NEW3 domain-containing protein [Dehalococcoidales bacterium]
MRIKARLGWLLLVLVALFTVSPVAVLAQVERIDLSLNLMPGDYYKEVTPGEEYLFYLEVRNIGNRPITNIRFSADEPEGWVVSFSPASISDLSAGSFQTVDVRITPATSAVRDDYQVYIIAEANELRRVISTTLRVETVNSMWLWIGLVVAVLVVAGFVVVYRRFGR